jgi:4-aminobutyrate aminotransferase-like enzyme
VLIATRFCAGSGDVVRLVPPLVVTDAEIDMCVEVLGKAVAQLKL